MKERPILFSAPMVRAILEGRKTQTRRVVNSSITESICDDFDAIRFEYVTGHKRMDEDNTEAWEYTGWLAWHDEYPEEGWIEVKCPYGVPGDRLWVRNTHYVLNKGTNNEQIWDELTKTVRFKANREIKDGFPSLEAWTKKPSIHMPRWASRILLEVVSVRVERLQDISVDDICDEGIPFNKVWMDAHMPPYKDEYRNAYINLWESINGPGSWEANPWVFVIEFKKIDGDI